MHTLDIILTVLAAFFMIIGIKRGCIGEIIRLAAMIGGCMVAFFYYHDLALKKPFLNLPLQTSIKNGIAFIAIYLLIALAIIAVGWLIKRLVHLTLLGWLDRLLGAVIGLLKTSLFAYVICLSISSLPIRRVQTDFESSVVFRTFTALPKGLTLRSLLQKREIIHKIVSKDTAARLDTLQKKIDHFKSGVDSTREPAAPKQ